MKKVAITLLALAALMGIAWYTAAAAPSATVAAKPCNGKGNKPGCPTTTLATTTTTRPPTTTVAPTTTTRPPTTTTQPPSGGRFTTLPVGAALPSGSTCATRVRSMTENRPQNATFNATVGTSPHNENPRVDGQFTGTTDEILQWAACKWGIDEDWLRAQIVTESWWDQRTVGDTAAGDGCTSHGVGQVRRCYHDPAFEDENAVRSTAYNADYTYSVWRACFNGELTWLNTVERGRDYVAGDLLGCMGVWFSGRWYTQPAVDYMNVVQGHFNSRTWTTASFGPASPDGGTPPTTTTAPPLPTTVAPTTTTTTTTTTTLPPAGPSDFVERFTGNTGLQRLDYGVHHRDEFAWADTWPGDHDMNCGSVDTSRTVHRLVPAESFYLCNDHLMTSIGDASSYSVGWFEPKQTFSSSDTTTVAWDVNVTNLGQRQWWEVVIVPASYESGFADCPHCSVHWALSPSPSNLPPYPAHTTALGLGPLGGDGLLVSDDEWVDVFGFCHTYDCIDIEGAGSKMIRRHFEIRDNRNGTISFDYFGSTYTYPGSFPSEFRVVFKDHNYTPSKDGTPAGFTWHWDEITIT